MVQYACGVVPAVMEVMAWPRDVGDMFGTVMLDRVAPAVGATEAATMVDAAATAAVLR